MIAGAGRSLGGVAWCRAAAAGAIGLAVALAGFPASARPGGGLCDAAWAAAKRAKQVPRGQTQAQFLTSCAIGMSSMTLANGGPPAAPVPPVTLPGAAPVAKVAVPRVPQTAFFPPTASLLPAFPVIGAPAKGKRAAGIGGSVLVPTSSLMPAFPYVLGPSGATLRIPPTAPLRAVGAKPRRKGG